MIGEEQEDSRALRILAVTNMYPTEDEPTFGIFVGQQIESLRRIGLSVDVLFLNRGREGRRVYWRLKPELSRRLIAFNPDIVHVMYGGIMADHVTRSVLDRPVVVTYHGSDLQSVGGLNVGASAIQRFGVWASLRAARRASGIVAVAGHLTTRLPSTVQRRRVRVIACGVDLERFKPLDREACRRQVKWKRDKFHVLFATNNDDPVKRPELARSAVEVLAAEGVEIELHILRGVAHPDVPVWLNACDVVLLTSLSEGSPTIVKEALACNRPVVSVPVGDVPEQIAGIAGCHIALASPIDLAKKLRLVHEGPGVVAGRERVGSVSLEATAERLRQFYEEVLGDWRGSVRLSGEPHAGEPKPEGPDGRRATVELER